MSLLDALHRHGALRTVDHALAQSLRRLDPATPDTVLASAALASQAIAAGHAGVDLARPGPSELDLPWPEPAAWCAALRDSRWVATPAMDAVAAADVPLVLEGNLLYLRRYREYERRLATQLRRLAAQPVAGDGADSAAVDTLFAALFPQRDDAQARAAWLALQRALLVITGGPGTGKTTTIARLLVLLLAQARSQARPMPRIALAAPTGRAAERMVSSLRQAVARLQALPGVDPALCAALPQQAHTLHRLLGTVPGQPRFRHGLDHPLLFDVIVVDEASMVDLPLMCKLVEAVPDGARLLLLGDPDQLPSVEAGDVLAAIVAAAVDETGAVGQAAGGERSAGDAALARPPTPGRRARADIDPGQADLFASPPAATPAEPSPTPAAAATVQGPAPARLPRVHLQRGYRQSEALELAPLAQAARTGDADTLVDLLRAGGLAGVHFHDGVFDPLANTGTDLLAPWRALADVADPTAALALADHLRILTAVRDGAQGAISLNARIEEALAGAQRESYFHGRLLLVTQNSYRHGLFNGDIGVCLRDAQGATVAWFAGSQGARPFHPAALPAHESAFAMTVHKSQGSEYGTVWLQLPRQDARTLSRELVYTALTRARLALHVAAGEDVLRTALARHVQRVSGLAARLA